MAARGQTDKGDVHHQKREINRVRCCKRDSSTQRDIRMSGPVCTAQGMCLPCPFD